jgi:hypothetical protein
MWIPTHATGVTYWQVAIRYEEKSYLVGYSGRKTKGSLWEVLRSEPEACKFVLSIAGDNQPAIYNKKLKGWQIGPLFLRWAGTLRNPEPLHLIENDNHSLP